MSENFRDPEAASRQVDPSEDNRAVDPSEGGVNFVDPSEGGLASASGDEQVEGGESPQRAGGINPVQHSE